MKLMWSSPFTQQAYSQVRLSKVLIVVAAIVVAVRLALWALRSDQGGGGKKWVGTIVEALRTGRPSGSNPYWRALPLRRTTRLLVGAFLLSSVVGFAFNLLVLVARRPLLDGLYWPLIIASLSTCELVFRLKKPRWAVLSALPAIGILLLAYHFQLHAQTLAASESIRPELLVNVFGIWIGAGLGFRLEVIS